VPREIICDRDAGRMSRCLPLSLMIMRGIRETRVPCVALSTLLTRLRARPIAVAHDFTDFIDPSNCSDPSHQEARQRFSKARCLPMKTMRARARIELRPNTRNVPWPKCQRSDCSTLRHCASPEDLPCIRIRSRC